MRNVTKKTEKNELSQNCSYSNWNRGDKKERREKGRKERGRERSGREGGKNTTTKASVGLHLS